jgi:putative transposase
MLPIFLFLSTFFRSRYNLGLEILALRQQLSGIKPKHTAPSSPWQNGIAGRWISSCRRELLDRVIAINESHLRRLIREYISYYNYNRTHDSLQKDSPVIRPISNKPDHFSEISSIPRVGGLHHRYDRKQAA